MPELPEVETVVRGIRPRLVGRRVVKLVQRRPDLRTALPKRFSQRVEGRLVSAVERRAKYILVRLDGRVDESQGQGDGAGDDYLIIHLGMSGRLVLGARPAHESGVHEHVEFATDDGSVFRFSDPRRFGIMDLVRVSQIETDPRFAPLGPEPLSPNFTAAVLGAALKGRDTSIKAALLDQRIVAGIGNIYACEALFMAGISPRRSAGTVQGDRCARLVEAIKDVLTRAIAAGGSSARDYVQASGEAGWFQHAWAVYDREGKPCPGCDCGRAVKRLVQGGRSTFYCAKRQR
jgi:formamidopyrimidine-DNA glycosylase